MVATSSSQGDRWESSILASGIAASSACAMRCNRFRFAAGDVGGRRMPWLQIVKRSQPRCKRSCLVDLAGWLRKCNPEMVQERAQGVGMQRGYADGLIATTKPVCLGRRNSIAFIEDERPPQHV